MKRSSFLKAVVAAALSTVPAVCAGPQIGLATSVGSFSLDSATVSGSASVFDGTALKTAGKPSDIRLQNGVEVVLATRSSGTVYNDRVALQNGAVRVSNFDNYTVQALRLQVKSEVPGSQAVVRVKGNRVEIASISGSLRVMNGDATLIRLASGTHTAFQQTGASPSTSASPASQTGQILPISDHTAFAWAAGIVGIAAIGLGAAALAMR